MNLLKIYPCQQGNNIVTSYVVCDLAQIVKTKAVQIVRSFFGTEQPFVFALGSRQDGSVSLVSTEQGQQHSCRDGGTDDTGDVWTHRMHEQEI